MGPYAVIMSSQANTPARKAPFGSWESPISAADVAGGSHPVQTGRYVRDQIWWSELRSSEGGRYSVRTTGANGEPVDILPAPWNARSRVHEYGGGAWTTTPTGSLVFVEFSDQRIYLLDERSEPKPLTPPSAGVNFGELSVRGDSVLAIQETYVGAQLTRHIVSIPLDGSASDDPQKLTEIVSGSDFLAYPRVSPDGKQLAWIAWNHPQMPWDGTELRIGSLNGSGQVDEYRTLIGADDESVLQPAWLDNETLLVISDRTGWWNLYEIGTDGEIQPALELESDIGGPLWNVGTTWYSPLDDGRVLFVAAHGADTLGILDLASRSHSWIESRFTTIALGAVSGTTVLLDVGSAQEAGGLRELDLISGEFRDIRLDVDTLPDLEYLPVAEERTFVRERDVHAIVYPPRNPGFVGLDGELPPYVAFVHGGPTAQTHASVNLAFAYYTSRGIGVIDVNYGGSTGYGREYRNRLRGQWGIVDVEDTVAAVLGLADAGLADPKRLAIEGG